MNDHFSAAKMHDWLKEHHREFPDTSFRTVYPFAMYIRQKYSVPLGKPSRDYFPVPELPYGDQAQIDFGFYNMRLANRKRKKESFFSMVLS